jgi:archaellum biogenesis protein FlaJ (TadC family)
MSEEIILEEERSSKFKIFLDHLNLDIRFISKIPVLFYSLIVFIIVLDIIIIIYGIIAFFLMIFLSKHLVNIFIKKIFKKNFNYVDIGRFYYTELGLTPREYNNLVLELLVTSILSLFINITLFALFFNYLKDSILNLILLIFFLIIPFILLIYFLLLPSIKDNSYNSDINKELPVATMLITAFSAGNIHPYLALSSLGKLKIFKGFRKVFMQIEKLRICLAIGPIEAISLFSKMLKNESLRKLLQTISAINLGSSIYSLLKEQMKENFKLFEKKIEEFIDRFNIILAAQLIVFILIPISAMMTLIFIQANTLSFIVFSLFILPLIFFFLFLIMIQSYALPFLRIRVKLNSKSLLFLCSIPISVFLMKMDIISLSLALFISLSASMTGLYIMNRGEAKEKEKLLNELPNIIKDIAEEVKKGNGLYQAIDKIAERYEQAGELLKKISFMRKLGISIEEIVEQEDLPYFFKQVLITLEECDKVGLDPSVVEEFSDFVNRLDSIRKIFKMKTRFFRYSSFLITALLGIALAISLAVIGNLVSVFKAITETAGIAYSLGMLNLQIPFDILKELVYSAGYLNSILLGFLGGYSDGNSIDGVKNSLIATAIYFVSLNFMNLTGFFH